MKRKRGSWSSEEDEESYEEDEESYDGSERTGSDEGHLTDPGYDYTQDDSLLLHDEDIFKGVSWERYLDSLMANTDRGVHLTAAGMYSIVNCQQLCDAGAFPSVSPDEAFAIAQGFDDPDYLDSRGLHLGGRKFRLIKRGPNIIRGVEGPDGCAIVKSSKTLIIGIFQHPMTFSECELVVGDVRDSLSRAGY